MESVSTYINRDYIYINKRFFCCWTLLHLAVLLNNQELTSLLLNVPSIDANVYAEDNLNLLHVVSLITAANVTKMLLQNKTKKSE